MDKSLKDKIDKVWEDLIDADSLCREPYAISIPYEDYLDLQVLPMKVAREIGFTYGYDIQRPPYLRGFSLIVRRPDSCYKGEWKVINRI